MGPPSIPNNRDKHASMVGWQPLHLRYNTGAGAGGEGERLSLLVRLVLLLKEEHKLAAIGLFMWHHQSVQSLGASGSSLTRTWKSRPSNPRHHNNSQ
jgi:hypothetical protein